MQKKIDLNLVKKNISQKNVTMTNLQFDFNGKTLNTIFPFYIFIDENLIIKGIGESISKMLPDLAEKELFTSYFNIVRPTIQKVNLHNFNSLLKQLVVITSKGFNVLTLRGQFEKQDNGFLFIGSPWFMSIADIERSNLLLSDFAYHDPLTEILQVLKNQETTNTELKELVETIEEQRKILKLDKEELNRLSLVASANKNGVVFTHLDGKIYWCNAAFLALTGFRETEIIGKSLIEIGSGKASDKDEIYKMVEAYYAGEAFDVEYLHLQKKETVFLAKIIGQPILDSNGLVSHYFAIVEDITLTRENELQKEALFNRLEEQNEQLNEYAQMVSHDLKSPLRSIHSLITWIKVDTEKEFSSETKEYIDLIEDKVEKMDHLIEGILTYSKVVAAKAINETTNLNEIIKNSIKIIYIPKNIAVTITNKLPTLLADRFRMQQLFQNLISNAVNYCDKENGFVEIASTEENDCYIFSIKDNGPGIELKYQDKIFKIFESFSQQEKSSGIGLSIVKRIVDNYKGEIWLESQLGLGTTFFIKLPKAHGAA